MMAESEVMDVEIVNEQSNGRRQNGELDIDFVPEVEQETDRWIDVATVLPF